MRPFPLRPLLGVLLCLLLALDAVGAAAATVRSLGGGCAHAQTTNVAASLPAHRHGGHGAQADGMHAEVTHAQDTHAHGQHAHHPSPHHGRIATHDTPQEATHSAAHDHQTPHHAGAAPGDGCDCDDGGCACPAACSLALASHDLPPLDARAPGDMTVGPRQHAHPAPPQPDTLRPPIG